MSQLNTRNALITKLLGSSIPSISDSDIAYDNKDFDPKGKTNWLSVYFMPADSNTMGKSQLIGDEERGLLQISVYVLADGYDIAMLTTIDEIKSAFKYGDVTTYAGQTVQILDKTVTPGNIEESWYKRAISINYLAFSAK